MRKLIFRMELTLDDVAAGRDGPVKGVDHGDEHSWRDIFTTLENVDTMLIGAGMHQEYLGYWQATNANPAAPANERRFAALAAQTPHLVISRTQQDLAGLAWGKPAVLAGGIAGIVALKQLGGKDIILWGGPTVAAAAINAGLIDEYHFITHPVIAGGGKRLFAKVTTAGRVRHLSTSAFPSGVVLRKYARA